MERTPLHEQLLESCQKDNLQEVRHLIHHEGADIFYYYGEVFTSACYNGSMNVIRYLTTSDKLEVKVGANSHIGQQGFISACFNGQLEVVKYLTSSPELEEHTNIYTEDSKGFRTAYRYGKLPIVQYLLFDEHLSRTFETSIPFLMNEAFYEACSGGFLDCARFYMQDPRIYPHIDVHMGNELPFRQAFMQQRIPILHFLIVELGIQRTSSIDSFMNQMKSYLPNSEESFQECFHYVEHLFNTVESHDKLDNSLQINPLNQRKRKI